MENKSVWKNMDIDDPGLKNYSTGAGNTYDKSEESCSTRK